MSQASNVLLQRLVGSRLYSVEFGIDHLQLRFENDDSLHMPFLTLDCMPGLTRAGRSYASHDPGYADALRALIASTVTGTAEVAGQGLLIELEGGAISIAPRTDEVASDEVGTLAGFDDGSTRVWRTGEDTFIDLA